MAQEGRKNIYGVADETIDEYLKGFAGNGVDRRKIMGINGMRFLFGEDWEKVIAEKKSMAR